MFTDHSPYHFGYNNPISFMDPLGLAPQGNDSESLPEIIINVPPQVPPGGDFGIRPIYIGNIFDLQIF